MSYLSKQCKLQMFMYKLIIILSIIIKLLYLRKINLMQAFLSSNSFWKLRWNASEIWIIYEVITIFTKYEQIKIILIIYLIHESAKINIQVLLFFSFIFLITTYNKICMTIWVLFIYFEIIIALKGFLKSLADGKGEAKTLTGGKYFEMFTAHYF